MTHRYRCQFPEQKRPSIKESKVAAHICWPPPDDSLVMTDVELLEFETVKGVNVVNGRDKRDVIKEKDQCTPHLLAPGSKETNRRR